MAVRRIGLVIDLADHHHFSKANPPFVTSDKMHIARYRLWLITTPFHL